ncbi:hypothetical protein ABBQ32_012210 [Trebouxia sp. C0010 RCD-2024]
MLSFAGFVSSRSQGGKEGLNDTALKATQPMQAEASTGCRLNEFCLFNVTRIHKMVGKEGGKAKPLKKAKKEGKELDETDLEFQKKKKEEAQALKALKEKAGAKGGFAKTKGSK